MGTTHTVANGQAAGKNGQELGLANELALLTCIKTEGWVREWEAGLITGMSRYMIGVVSRRLEMKGDIFREQSKNLTYVMNKPIKHGKPPKRERLVGNAGYFLRLTAAGADRVDGKSGKDIEIPACWKHHAMAIQTLHFLAQKFGCTFETDASMRRRIAKGKLPDGKLISADARYFFEQEYSRKSGPALRKQTEVITRLADEGFICFLGYPYPANVCGGIDHETRLTNSLRHRWGRPAAHNIKLVRCHFDSLIACHNIHVSRFEIIDLPGMKDTPAARKGLPGVTDQVKGFKWIMQEKRLPGDCLTFIATLQYDGETWFEGVFIEGVSEDDYHRLESDGDVVSEGYADLSTFNDFVLSAQKAVEARIAGDIRMCEMQKAAESQCAIQAPE